MHITQWGEYGVHCAVFIAQRCNFDNDTGASKAVKASEIAEFQGIPTDYAQQILQRLRAGNIITSVRGPQGGYCLAKPAAEITLKDIIAASEGDTLDIICETKPITSERCGTNTCCYLKPVWFGLKEQVNKYLEKFTLAELVNSANSEALERKQQNNNFVQVGQSSARQVSEKIVRQKA